MFSRFFIERPIFAMVIAIVTALVGAVAMVNLPVEQYPEITPPTIRVTANYPGANAQVVNDTVAAPVEQQVNGVEGMLYMSSTCSADGSYSLTVTFDIGTDLDAAQVLVQNRVAIAEPLLPEEVRRQGITVKKQSSNIILVVSLVSPDQTYGSLFLSNYATLRLRDELSRIDGVGEVTVFGTGNYSMRIWLDPAKLKVRDMTAGDVIAAIREQNVQVAAGQVGQPPVDDGQVFQYTVTAQGRLSDVEQFEDVIVKTGRAGETTYLRDVARVELGAQSYDQFNLKEGQANANIGIFQLPGSNAVDVAERVRAAMEQMAESFPEDLAYEIPLDTTAFVDASIHEVYRTLLEAGVLVLLVIVLFLQDWRAVLIPAVTIPVTIIGAFAFMAGLGFTINMLTLFGLVLAIAIVIDDAIVVVENAARHVEEGNPPKQATIRGMKEVIGPIIGITLVLLAVFIPSAALGGITGQFYRQFALTIAATMVLSAVNALTLAPAQCAMWLRPPKEKKNWIYRAFNYVYGLIERAYTAIIRVLVRQVAVVMVAFVALVALTAWWYNRVPTGLLPTEDQGYILMAVKLPDAAAQERTREVLGQIDRVLVETPGVASWISIGGLSLLDQSSASNAGTLFVTLKPWDERREPEQSLEGILGHLQRELADIQEAVVLAFPPPGIRGLGVRAGFDMQIEDRENVGMQELGRAVQVVVDAANGQTGLQGLNTMFRPGVPQLYADVNREKVQALNVPLDNLFLTLQAYLGSVYVNDFNKFGRTYQVRVQAEPDARDEPDDIRRLEVRNSRGEMIPVGTLATIEDRFGPQIINRYNLYPSAAVTGEPAPGYSTGDALALMEQVAESELPASMGYEWTGMAYQEKQVGGEAIFVFAMAVVLVYLVLAAQYESWFLPWAVVLVVPLGVLGAIAAVSLRGLDNNIYTQVGIILIIALACKNAILIVEFGRELRAAGRPVLQAAVEASRLRFRPILMTSFAFILGMVPLLVAEGAGAAGQRALGTAVFGGMISATVLAVFFVPPFFVIFQRLEDWRTGRKANRERRHVPAHHARDHGQRDGKLEAATELEEVSAGV